MNPMSTQKQVIGLLAWLLVSYSASIVGGLASMQSQLFYSQVIQPGWAPPAWVFAPVWTVLYGLMGIAAWLVWRNGGFASHKVALCLFLLQLLPNALWTWLFFGWQMGALAFADIVLLWLLILATLVAFWRARPLAGALLLPYLLWVSFAALLNYSLWQLNPQLLG